MTRRMAHHGTCRRRRVRKHRAHVIFGDFLRGSRTDNAKDARSKIDMAAAVAILEQGLAIEKAKDA